MRFITLIPEGGTDGHADELLRLATSRGWATGPEALRFVNGRNARSATRAATFVSASWELHGAAGEMPNLSTYESVLDLVGTGVVDSAEAGWVALRNGRYALELREKVIEEALRLARADVVVVTVDPERRAYREKLRVTSDGTLLGFRRLYRDEVVPAVVPEEWPHLLFVRKTALEALDNGRSLPAVFAALVSQVKENGVLVQGLAVGGRTWDLASPAGLLTFFAQAVAGSNRKRPVPSGDGVSVSPKARIQGTVLMEKGVRVEDDAVVLGPTFLGRGARVGRGALVRQSIVAPGVEVPGGGMVRNQVVCPSFSVCVDAAVLAESRAAQGDGSVFRRWPLLSYASLGKRLLDIAGSLVTLCLTAIIFPVIAMAIKLNSKGPVFYLHRRQGRHGKEFRCIKFRTMVTQAHQLQDVVRAVNEVDGPQFKIEEDPRVTLVGSFLRQTNLDEIPQFINVLLGHMSFVGPRPSPDEENQMCPAWREARLSVRPGITGLWQVARSKDRANDFQEWIHYDTEYVRGLSLWLDVVIVVKTLGILLTGFARLFTAKENGTEATTNGRLGDEGEGPGKLDQIGEAHVGNGAPIPNDNVLVGHRGA